MPANPPRFDHVVVLMFENRSFDNLFGYLYDAGEVPHFEGLVGKSISNPLPPELASGGRSVVPVHPAQNMDTPDPDPGEEYPHVNTQLFDTVAPPANRFAEVDRMEMPFNAPPEPAPAPTMQGFVRDYYAAFRVEMKRPPTREEVAQIMACYTREQLPVLTTLAREFGCFDHWFCEVPSQTYANRSFFHAASSSGLVLNAPAGSFATLNDAPTIFERLQDHGRSWKVYIDPEQILPATGLIHARRLAKYFATNFSTTFDFLHEAREGTLPDYAFIEPNMFHPHTDMHPPGAARLRHDLGLPPPRSMAGGEELLAQVYDAVRTSSSPTGSNFRNTLLLVTFDEHGGIHDHVPPPPAPAPGDTPRQQEGFAFDRSGVRIPTVVVSAWVDPRTVIGDEFRSTALIRTLRERWDLGGPLTRRDAIAPDIAPYLVRTTARELEAWPVVTARPRGELAGLVAAVEPHLSRLEKDLVGEALAHEAALKGETSGADLERMSRREARSHLRRIQANLFPGIHHGRTG
jgi:phospholipase C